MDTGQEFLPVRFIPIKIPHDEGCIDTPFAQFDAYAQGSETLAHTLIHVVCGKSLVALHALPGDSGQHRCDCLLGMAPLQQLAPQLGTRMLTGGQQAQGGLLDGLAILRIRTQALAPLVASGTGVSWGNSRARILASISAAMSVFSLRKLRTLSLPWPMRLPS